MEIVRCDKIIARIIKDFKRAKWSVANDHREFNNTRIILLLFHVEKGMTWQPSESAVANLNTACAKLSVILSIEEYSLVICSF